MAKKAAEAFRTISEVSEWLDEPGHVLRFWESKFSQVKPVKRAGGRRYYRPSDMELLGGIKVLLHERGLTIKNVQQILKDEGIKHVQSMSPELTFQTERRGRKSKAKPAKVAKPVETTEVDPVARDSESQIAGGEPTVQKTPATTKSNDVASAPSVPAEDKQDASVKAPSEDAARAAISAAVVGQKRSTDDEGAGIRKINISKSASTMTASEISEIEDLYYALKKVRNRMKRAHHAL